MNMTYPPITLDSDVFIKHLELNIIRLYVKNTDEQDRPSSYQKFICQLPDYHESNYVNTRKTSSRVSF